MFWNRDRQKGADISEEFELHIEELADDLERTGIPRKEALRRARLEFGPIGRYAEEGRQAKGWGLLDDLRADTRYAFRGFLGSPVFTVTAVAILTIAIGANTALFTVLNEYLWKPLPIRDPYHHVEIGAVIDKRVSHGWSYADYEQMRDSGAPFADLYVRAMRQVPMLEPQQRNIRVEFAGSNFLQSLGAGFAMGRGWTAGEGPVAVLSHQAWRSIFHSDPAVVGRTVRIRSRLVTIMGVTARDFLGLEPAPPELWAPIEMLSALTGTQGAETYTIGGHLLPGVSRAQAEAALGRLKPVLKSREKIEAIAVEPMSTYISPEPEVMAGVTSLFAAFGLVLFIACANLANLLLARGTARGREFAIRLSLGAPRGRIIRQLLTESVWLSLVAGICGATASTLSISHIERAIFAILTKAGIYIEPITTDWRVFCFTAAVATVAGIAFGLLPALRISRAEGRGATRNDRMQAFLVAGQVAASVMLLVLASTLVRDSARIADASPGYPMEALIEVEPGSTTPRDRLIREIEANPRFIGYTFTYNTPLHGPLPRTSIQHEGKSMRVGHNTVDSRYFETFDMPIVDGRNFRDADQGARVVVISRKTAALLWPSANPIGRMIHTSDPSSFDSFERGAYEVIGVVPDVISGLYFQGLDASIVYFPPKPAQARLHDIVVRVRSDAPGGVEEIKRICGKLDSNSLCRPHSLTEAASVIRYPYTVAAFIASCLGGVALLLTSVGLYGLISYSVAQRLREIGIRVALGATRLRVARLFLGQACRRVLIGLAIGLPIAIGAMYGISSVIRIERLFDPMSFILVPILFLAIALAATWPPVRTGTRVDPAAVLRHD